MAQLELFKVPAGGEVQEIWLRRNATTGWYEFMVAHSSLGVFTDGKWHRLDQRAWFIHGTYRGRFPATGQLRRDFPQHDVVWLGTVLL